MCLNAHLINYWHYAHTQEKNIRQCCTKHQYIKAQPALHDSMSNNPNRCNTVAKMKIKYVYYNARNAASGLRKM